MLTVPPRENIYINLLACLHSSQALKYLSILEGICLFRALSQANVSFVMLFFFCIIFKFSTPEVQLLLMKEHNQCSLQNKSFFKENHCLHCVAKYTKTAFRIGNQEQALFVVLKCAFFC